MGAVILAGSDGGRLRRNLLKGCRKPRRGKPAERRFAQAPRIGAEGTDIVGMRSAKNDSAREIGAVSGRNQETGHAIDHLLGKAARPRSDDGESRGKSVAYNTRLRRSEIRQDDDIRIGEKAAHFVVADPPMLKPDARLVDIAHRHRKKRPVPSDRERHGNTARARLPERAKEDGEPLMILDAPHEKQAQETARALRGRNGGAKP